VGGRRGGEERADGWLGHTFEDRLSCTCAFIVVDGLSRVAAYKQTCGTGWEVPTWCGCTGGPPLRTSPCCAVLAAQNLIKHTPSFHTQPFLPACPGWPDSLLAAVGLSSLRGKWPPRLAPLGEALGQGLTAAAADHLGLLPGTPVAQGGAGEAAGWRPHGGLRGGAHDAEV
jgi:hypothetical protein